VRLGELYNIGTSDKDCRPHPSTSFFSFVT
jgi:hypothetical protein